MPPARHVAEPEHPPVLETPLGRGYVLLGPAEDSGGDGLAWDQRREEVEDAVGSVATRRWVARLVLQADRNGRAERLWAMLEVGSGPIRRGMVRAGVENRSVESVALHYGVLGQLVSAIGDLPDGAAIGGFEEGPDTAPT